MYLERMITQMTRYMYNAIKGRQENSLLTLKRVDKRYDKNIQNIFI